MAYSQIYLGTATTLSGLSLTNSTALIVDRGNQTIIGALDRSAAVSTCDIIWGKASTVTFKGTSGDATGRNTLVVVAGGSYTTERGVSGTYNQGGGTAVFSRSDSSGALPTASGATMNIFGGTMKWRGKNIGTLNVYGGTVDFSEAPQDLTVTTLNITRTSRDASTFKSKFSTVTVTTTNVRGAEADVTY